MIYTKLCFLLPNRCKLFSFFIDNSSPLCYTVFAKASSILSAFSE
nr:MAG TPA: hypothetical protein [Caudoviricetes sp.]